MTLEKADIIYLDCFSGISGDMFIGAMLDLGYPKEEFLKSISLLSLSDDIVDIYEEKRLHIKGTGIAIKNAVDHDHTPFSDIRSMIESSQLHENVKKLTLKIFQKIASAEAKIHGQNPDDITFHEVGALDSIIDIVGAASIRDFFKNSTFIASPLRVGHGFVTCKHGTYPVPAPATLEILKEIPLSQDDKRNQELITPTGAALLATFCNTFAPIPQGKIMNIGYGIGKYDDPQIPDVLRVLAIKQEKAMPCEKAHVIETEIDDMNPEWLGFLMEQLYAAKALDVFYTSIYMKKNRPGTLVTVLCNTENLKECIAIIFKHSTTLGIRLKESNRIALRREIKEVMTPYGLSKVKIGYLDNCEPFISPEYEACKELCNKAGISIKTAYSVTIQSYQK
ncbi:MAG: nickel pincer cofactor biosynthesis protein LarC [bacterium]